LVAAAGLVFRREGGDVHGSMFRDGGFAPKAFAGGEPGWFLGQPVKFFPPMSVKRLVEGVSPRASGRKRLSRECRKTSN
jgi:hypothetical protein